MKTTKPDFVRSLTPEQHHHLLFYSPVLEKLVIPFLPDGLCPHPVQPSVAVGQGELL